MLSAERNDAGGDGAGWWSDLRDADGFAGRARYRGRVAELLKEARLKTVATPPSDAVMGICGSSGCSGFAEMADLDREQCTIEEREEYEAARAERNRCVTPGWITRRSWRKRRRKRT